MKRVIRELRKSSVLHYIVAFSALIVLIIVLMGGYLYRFYYRTIYSDFLQSNEAYLTAAQNRHENDMQVIKDIMMQVSLSGDVTNFMLEEQPTKSIRLKEQLYQYATVSQFFNQIFFLNHNDKYIFNQSTSVEKDMFVKKGLLLENVKPETLMEYLYSEEGELYAMAEQNVSGYFAVRYGVETKRGVLYITPISPKKTSTMAFLVRDSYYDTLFETDAADRRLSLIVDGDEIVVQRGTIDLTEESLRELLGQIQEGAHRVSIQGEKYLLVTGQGDSGLVYGTLQPISVFQSKIMSGHWGILFVLLICSVPTAIAIVFFSKSISAKIRSINILLSDDKDDYYDINNIEMGIKALVESKREAAKTNEELMKTRFIRSFIREDFADREAVLKAAEAAGLHIDYQYYLVAVMGDRGNSNENKAHTMMLEAIAAEQNVAGYGVSLLNHNQSLYLLFSDDKELVEQILEKMLALGKAYCEDFVMAISDFHEDFRETSQVYLEADTAYDNRLLVDNSRVIRFGDISNREHVEILPVTYMQRLKNAIRTNNETEIRSTIGEICEKLKKENQSLLTFRLLYNDMIRMLIGEWNDAHTDFKNIYNVFTLSQCLTIQDFNDVLMDVCHALMSGRDVGQDKTSDLITNAVSYMKAHFQEAELNMGSLAEHLQVSPVTLAVEFKNGMGMSPSDYLASIRMEKAKELLKETSKKIMDISYAVGYEDDHVFMRRFKKYTGKTPGQYRADHVEL